jgi:amidase
METDRRAFLKNAGAMAATALPTRWGATSAQAASGAAGDLAYRSVSELRAMLDARQVSAKELAEHAINRIEARDGAVNAVVVRDFERARVAALQADAALGRGERAPLLGVPLTVKEAFNVGGLPTSWGLPNGRDWKPAEDSATVARLRTAGAVILGKTNLPTGISDWQSFNAIYGTTNNPYDLKRTPGGSSGGSAAALASGYVPLELGSDISGSIRVPAHLCGVFGHKPSSGVIPQRGHTPPGAPPSSLDFTYGLGVCGPMARTAADLELALDILAGPDQPDKMAYRLSLPPSRRSALGDFRILVIDDHPLLPVANDVRGALDAFANRLSRMGASVARSSPLLPDLAESARLHTRMVRNVIAFGRPREFFEKIRAEAAALKQDDHSLKAERLRAPLLTHMEWIAAEFARQGLRQQWAALFGQFDIVLCPPFPVTAFPHDQKPDQEERTIDIDGQAFPYLSLIVWSTLATPPGLPATTMPIGRSTSGLPIGVQIIGPALEDRTTLAFAKLAEREFGGFTAPPGFAG